MQIRSRTALAAAVGATLSALALSACAPGGASSSDEDAAETIHIVGFAVPEAANKAIAEEFAKTPDGEGVEFQTSYGPSGDQSRAVAAGLKADYVHMSVPTDVTRLVDEGLVADDWDAGDNKGVVSTSVVAFGVRDGNPKNIKTWADLVKPGVEIVTANPASSGAARWNALAAYGQVISDGGTDEEATAYVDKFFKNVVSLPGSGRDATTAFLGGTGDVLMAYENEAILAAQNDEAFEYIIPETTLKIENAGAILKDASEPSQAWLDFVLSDEGQRQFALTGFRPLRDDVDYGGTVEGATDPSNPFPEVPTLLTVDEDFGGWDEVSTKFFDEENGIIFEAILNAGLSLE
ncbi:sulfate ABC transporter substrate-binding protein [Nocardioides sp. zg-1228]|uniref:sulfate ABC transporter substrate-binding protein n=1 Tax=Nocardioides sp. zg-1228 TaxID=2763008 RepID=UPI001642C245|nr:sulfate ABC transporter substrate-binding protein [Nocardioides sp. zg-1228]MBC2932709.1 sulfate ABC transporter substrate-binding protein [Nocardioides sp. zg-1228]QSF58188.1 sulfate ABC transporter substrate-binding protein [Nocardioides sp. zg-1228]